MAVGHRLGVYAALLHVTVTDVHREELAEKYYMEIFAAHDDWQEVQISGWDQAVYRRHTNTLREEWHNDSDKIPADITLHHQNLMMRLGNRVVVVSYTGEADMYSRLNTLYGRRTPSPAAEKTA